MTVHQLEVLLELRHEGHAVIVWTPEELSGVPPKYVEDASIPYGWDVIDALRDDDHEK